MPHTNRPLNHRQMAAFAGVSTPAKRLFTNLMTGKFYLVQFGNESRYWIELQDAGLVRKGGRVAVTKAAYVPVGTQPFTTESFPTWPPMVIEPKGE